MNLNVHPPLGSTSPAATTMADRMRCLVAAGSYPGSVTEGTAPLADRIDASNVIPAYDGGPAPNEPFATLVSINAAVSRTIYIPGSPAYIVSTGVPANNRTITIPPNGTLAGIGGDAESITLTAGPRNPEQITADIQAKLRAASFAGAGGVTADTEGAGAHRRFVITLPPGVPVSARVTGTAASVLGFGETGPRSSPRTWAEIHDRVSVQWFRRGALDSALAFTSWVYSPLAADMATELGLVVLGLSPLRDLSDLISEQWEERASVDVGFGYSVYSAGVPDRFLNPDFFSPLNAPLRFTTEIEGDCAYIRYTPP